MQTLKKTLISLRMKGIADNIEFRLSQAESTQMSHLDFLKSIIEDEQVRRTRKSYEKRLRASGVKPNKTLDNYIFSQQPSINRDLIYTLANCDFIKQKEKLIAMGVQGVGKSHLINALGICALEKGHVVYSFNANELADLLLEAKVKKTYNDFIKRLLKADLIIVDEFAMREFSIGGVDELFALFSKLDEQTSLALTTNRDFKDWKPFFADHTLASAFTDRVINNAILIKVESGVSERLKNFERKNLYLELH